MILAERQHLEDLMAQQAVEIRIKEEKILSKSFRTLSSLATYLAASAFAILRATPTYLTKNHSYLDANASRDQQKGTRPENDPETVWLVTQTEGLAALALCFCVLVLAVSSWCLIFGTDLAFRGADQGSMTRALDGLYAERKYAIRFFLSAVMLTCLSAMSHTVLVMGNTWLAAIPVAAFATGGVVTAVYMIRRVRPRFRFPEGKGKTDAKDLYFNGGFDPEMRRNVEVWADKGAPDSGGFEGGDYVDYNVV